MGFRSGGNKGDDQKTTARHWPRAPFLTTLVPEIHGYSYTGLENLGLWREIGDYLKETYVALVCFSSLTCSFVASFIAPFRGWGRVESVRRPCIGARISRRYKKDSSVSNQENDEDSAGKDEDG